MAKKTVNQHQWPDENKKNGEMKSCMKCLSMLKLIIENESGVMWRESNENM